jgi:hypothetical protein
VIDFRYQGENSSFRPRYLFPVEKTIEAAVHFYKTGKLPDWMDWAEFNPKTKRLEVPTPNRSAGPIAPGVRVPTEVEFHDGRST